MSGDTQADRLVEMARLATVGELTAGVAHEINNPLFAIMGLVELLLMDAEPGTKTQERLELVQETAAEIKTIVRTLLDFARPATDEPSLLRLEDVANASVELFRRLSADKGVKLVERYGPGETTVRGSRARLEQVFVQLLVAARGGATVTVSVEPSGDRVVAEIGYEGAEPVDEGDPGLAAARVIAELHGGALAVDRTTFRLSLPRADRDGDEQTTLPGGG
jgi:signal transduction histidine kinase